MSEQSIVKAESGMTPERRDLLKRTLCRKASDDEFRLFLGVCERTGLDPFARQIYAMMRREYDRDSGQWIEKMSTQVSIDGLRLVAQRSHEYEGQTAPAWCDDKGVWHDVWLSTDTFPAACKVGVWRKGFRESCVAIALWREYAPYDKDKKLGKMWAKMPALMLAKVAEALALRKAFPQELSGLYSSEEMEQAGGAVIDVVAHVAPPSARLETKTAETPAAPETPSAPATPAEQAAQTEEKAPEKKEDEPRPELAKFVAWVEEQKIPPSFVIWLCRDAKMIPDSYKRLEDLPEVLLTRFNGEKLRARIITRYAEAKKANEEGGAQ